MKKKNETNQAKEEEKGKHNKKMVSFCSVLRFFLTNFFVHRVARNKCNNRKTEHR